MYFYKISWRTWKNFGEKNSWRLHCKRACLHRVASVPCLPMGISGMLQRFSGNWASISWLPFSFLFYFLIQETYIGHLIIHSFVQHILNTQYKQEWAWVKGMHTTLFLVSTYPWHIEPLLKALHFLRVFTYMQNFLTCRFLTPPAFESHSQISTHLLDLVLSWMSLWHLNFNMFIIEFMPSSF